MGIFPHTYPKLPYDPVAEFTPIGGVAFLGALMVLYAGTGWVAAKYLVAAFLVGAVAYFRGAAPKASPEASNQRDGAMRVDMPEVSVRVRDGDVTIRTIPPLRSRDLVQYAMILAGEAAARFGTTRGIPLPFATQEPPDYFDFDEGQSRSLSAMFAQRRTFRRSQYRSVPAPHSALGLSAYAQATSPMRRYLDLVSRLDPENELDLRGLQLPEDPLLLSYLSAMLLQLPPHEKQPLLEAPDAHTLLQAVLRLVRREAAVMGSSRGAEKAELN